ncbi:MAG: hypothetical protein ACYDDO_11720 [Acidiferrobacterales bacterium]
MAVGLIACGGGSSSGSSGSSEATTAPASTGQRPTITCADPINGAILNQAPGQVTVTGSVVDPSGFSSLQVNGAPVAVDASGAFAAQVNAIWGVNFVDLVAMDGAGHQASRTCAFLLSETWAPDDAVLPDAISFKAEQPVFDDSNRTGAINSLADILYTIFNSTGMRDSMRAAMVGKTWSQSQCTVPNPILGGCLVGYAFTVRITDFQNNGPNANSLSLVSNGLHGTVGLNNTSIGFEVSGNVSNVPFDVTGSVDVGSVSVDVPLLAMTIFQGKPSVSLGNAGGSATLGQVVWHINGLPNAIIKLVSATLTRTFLNEIVPSLTTGFLTSVISSLQNSLDVHNFARTFDLPRLDGTGFLNINFATNFLTLDTTSGRMLATLGTQIQTTPATISGQSRSTPGAPIPFGARALDPDITSSVGVALHVGLFDQALYALWRGGYFDVTFGAGALNGVVPNGVELQVSAGLPPTVQLQSDGRVQIALGAANVHLTYPSVLSNPADLGLGGRVSCAMLLSGQNLLLRDCRVDELHISPGSAALDAQAQTAVDQLLTNVLTQMLAVALNNALPTLPIPDYAIPPSLTAYGVPSGSLGLVNPALSSVGEHLLLQGDLGLH